MFVLVGSAGEFKMSTCGLHAVATQDSFASPKESLRTESEYP